MRDGVFAVGLQPASQCQRSTIPFTHTSRTGKTYYLHTGPKRAGGIQYFLSTKLAGPLAEAIPAGFEVYETVNGQVYLRRQLPRLIREAEVTCVRRQVPPSHLGHLYQVEAQGKTITIHESSEDLGLVRELAPYLSSAAQQRFAERSAHYQPALRFILSDPVRRRFLPERYCFRGSVDDWITLGPPGPLPALAARFLKHLGQDSFYDLF